MSIRQSISRQNLPNKEYFIFVKFPPPSSPKKISIPVKIVHRIQRRENWINSKKRERERIYRSGASFQFLLQDKRKNWGGEVERGG